MRERIISLAKTCDADIVGFAPASRFDKDDAIFKILPEVETVIGLGFRVLRGIYRGVEEGTTYYQYTTMGVENLEETVMPMALLRIANLIESEGAIAIPQRRSPLIRSDEDSTDPEVDYTDVYRGVTAENQLDFLDCAIRCGLGERSMIGSLLTPEFGPFIRYCFILTDMKLEATPVQEPTLCDGCGECVRACPGGAIGKDGVIDSWRCAVYYNGANGSKNPFMPPDAFSSFDDEKRMAIIGGSYPFDKDEAREILDNIYFYPPAKHFYRTSICGRACDRACYAHLEEKGLITKKYNRPFRVREEWSLPLDQFEKKGKES
ncbi:MAG: 4Fe-4S binding protein [Clostridia bacterium]|nr:4Fe-4S binding protein [Clostridia bacterium]